MDGNEDASLFLFRPVFLGFACFVRLRNILNSDVLPPWLSCITILEGEICKVTISLY